VIPKDPRHLVWEAAQLDLAWHNHHILSSGSAKLTFLIILELHFNEIARSPVMILGESSVCQESLLQGTLAFACLPST
jgi:hypothetical protein